MRLPISTVAVMIRLWPGGLDGLEAALTAPLALCEHPNVNVISSRTIKEYAALHEDAAEKLFRWRKAASGAAWHNFHDVREEFPDADQFKSLPIFNIRHNRYRQIVKVDYRAKPLM